MMKNILTILMLCVFACACTNSETKRDKVKTDAEEQGLKGKVKSVRETTYEAVDEFGEVIIGELTDDDFYKYNDKGNKIEESEYNPEGSLCYRAAYKYDDKGNRIEMNEYNSGSKLLYKTIFKYNDKGKLIEESKYDSVGSLYTQQIYEYDHSFFYFKGRQTEINEYNSDGNLEKTVKCNDKGNAIEATSYNSDGSLSSRTTYKYDDKGNEIEMNLYTPDGSLAEKSTYKYKYDSKGNWIEKIYCYGEAEIAKTTTERTIEYYE